MSRFPLVPDDQVHDPIVAAVYDEIRRELGFGIVPNLFRSMAVNPPVLKANWDKFRATILHGRLPRTLKEMVGVLISQANQSEYAMRVHLHGLSAMGMSDAVLQALIADYMNCPLPEREKQIFRFGLLVATDPLSITDADYDRLRQHDLNESEIFEIIATADLFASVNAYTDAIDLELDSLG
ncbi:MAG: carboxymuconolactone decarboxylase family protein [Roseiflexaceae bacterium]